MVLLNLELGVGISCWERRERDERRFKGEIVPAYSSNSGKLDCETLEAMLTFRF